MKLRSIRTETLDGGYTVVPSSIRRLDISGDAKIIYSLIYSRLCLSIKNGWKDADGVPYCNYRREEMASDAGIHVRKVDRCMGELKAAGVVRTIQEYGQKPRRIYLFEIVEDESEEEKTEKLSTEKVKEPRQKRVTKRGLPKVGAQKVKSGLPKNAKWVTKCGKHRYIYKYIRDTSMPRARASAYADDAGTPPVDNFSTAEERAKEKTTSASTIQNTNTKYKEVPTIKDMRSIEMTNGQTLPPNIAAALYKIKKCVTAKDRAEIKNMIDEHGCERVLSAIETIRARGTNIGSVSYIRTMLADKPKPTSARRIDYATWGRAGNLVVQPIETRYTEAEMAAIITRKIAESRGELYA
jgi:hypothetical protein